MARARLGRMVFVSGLLIAARVLLTAPAASAQDDIRELKLRDWAPRSMLVTKTTLVEKPRFTE